jgi:cysteine desulfuration protein SufE
MLSLDEIEDNFEILGDWDQRYEYIDSLGKKLPPIDDQYKVDDNKVKGCMSQVWIVAYRDPENPDKVNYYAECDTSIIQGVLAILVGLCEGRTVEEIQQLDIDEVFKRLDLFDHLSPTRHVGVYAIVELMKQKARELDNSSVQSA